MHLKFINQKLNSKTGNSISIKQTLMVTAVSAAIALAVVPTLKQPAQAEATAELLAAGVNTLAPLVEKVTPGVVNVSVKSKVAERARSPLFEDEFFRRFFEMPDGQSKPREREAQSVGSGVIVDAEKGYVLTNNHVIEDADEIVVKLKDGRELTAELIGADEGTDIAVLKIEPKNLTEVVLGDSDSARVGDFVVAVGNPFGIGQTVTSGIVSAVGRTGLNLEGYENFIQTDASINPGNSGGALVSMDGKLMGINTAIIAPARGNVGIGFAVPANMAKSVMDQLIEHGEVKRGQIGVVIQDVNPELVEALDLQAEKGALISQVVPGSPAEKAGLQSGDVITKAGGRDVKALSDLRNQVGLVRLGEEIEIEYIREGKPMTAVIEVDNVSAFAVADGKVGKLEGAKLKEEGKHVVIDNIEPDSKAASYGLETGDKILAVNRQNIENLAELAEAFDKKSNVYALLVERNRSRLFIIIR
jgi:Do/DeqQ family serine protease